MYNIHSATRLLVGITIVLSLLACNNDKKGDSPSTDSLTGKKTIMPDSTRKEDIILIRTIAVPIETVYQAWTQPDKVMKWWGPRSFTSPTCSIDLKEGGRYIFSMLPPGGQAQAMYTSGIYTKIIPNQYLEFGQQITDKDGKAIDPFTLGMPPDFPKEAIRTSIALESRGSITVMTVTEYDWKTGQMRDMSAAGLGECLDKMVEYVLTGMTQ